MKQQEKGYAENPDYITQSAALQEVEMFHPTFNRYANMLAIRGIREGRCMFYKRSDIERIKSMKSNIVSRAIEIIEKQTNRKIKEIVFEPEIEEVGCLNKAEQELNDLTAILGGNVK